MRVFHTFLMLLGVVGAILCIIVLVMEKTFDLSMLMALMINCFTIAMNYNYLKQPTEL